LTEREEGRITLGEGVKFSTRNAQRKGENGENIHVQSSTKTPDSADRLHRRGG